MNHLWRFLARSLAAGLVTLASTSAWAYSCSVTVTDTGVLYTTPTPKDSTGSVTINCTRTGAEANTLSYRIKADNGLNFAAANRRARLLVSANYLRYFIRRGASAGAAAACANTSNWSAPATGTTNVMRGTLNFGTNLVASATWNYCLRVRIGVAPNPAAPAAGVYTDTLQVFAQYPDSDVGILTASVGLDYSVGVTNQCVFNTFPTGIAFTYTAFSTTAVPSVPASQTFNLRCSTALPWSIAVSTPPSPPLGLNYTLTLNPLSGTGTGVDQAITLTGNMPAGQAGTCSTASCTATQPTTVTITY